MLLQILHLLLGFLYHFGSQTEVSAKDQLLGDVPWIVAHRGASGLLPEHTIEAYKLAIAQGAHFIECDVVLTRDCQPICRHEPDISQTTDASIKFPERQRNVTIDGIVQQGIFAIDLTLQEIKSLQALQPRAYRDQSHNGLYSIPTLQEYIAVAQTSARQPVGIYPETKHPTWHDAQQLSCMRGTHMTALVLQVLQQHGYGAALGTREWRRRPAFIQSFEVNNLKWLSTRTSIPLLQLMEEGGLHTPDTNATYGDMMTDEGLAEVARYADGIGPWKGSMVPADGSEPHAAAQRLGARAHAYGLLVHPYTFRDDASLLNQRWDQQPSLEYAHFLDKEDIDGAFTDYPASLAQVLQQRSSKSKVSRATDVGSASTMSKAQLDMAVKQSLAEI